MRRSDWLAIQRGMLLAMEELARHAVHNQSAILYTIRKARQEDVGSFESATMESMVDTLLHNQTSALIAIVHHVVYAHRHALVRDRSNEGKAVVSQFFTSDDCSNAIPPIIDTCHSKSELLEHRINNTECPTQHVFELY